MRTVNTTLVEKYAEKIRPDLELAKRAYGSQKPGSPAREASNRVNRAILDFANAGGNMTHLAQELEGDISLPGLRRRLRVARAQAQGVGLSPNSARGSRDPDKITAAAARIRAAKNRGPGAYGAEVRAVHDEGVSLAAVAQELQISYYSIWTAASSVA